MTKKLSQVITVEKSIKSAHHSNITKLHRKSKAHDLFSGISKRYNPKAEDGERYPPEDHRVRARAEEQIALMWESWIPMADNELTKDMGNCDARAMLSVDGETIGGRVPATFLLWLEKQLNDLQTFVDDLPTLDESEDWTDDSTSGLHRTQEIETQRTAKVQEPIVLYDATTEHPAQTQLVTRDVVVGYWKTVKFSGSMPPQRQRRILQRIADLKRAVKTAREAANSTEVEEQKIAGELLGFIFAD